MWRQQRKGALSHVGWIDENEWRQYSLSAKWEVAKRSSCKLNFLWEWRTGVCTWMPRFTRQAIISSVMALSPPDCSNWDPNVKHSTGILMEMLNFLFAASQQDRRFVVAGSFLRWEVKKALLTIAALEGKLQRDEEVPYLLPWQKPSAPPAMAHTKRFASSSSSAPIPGLP